MKRPVSRWIGIGFLLCAGALVLPAAVETARRDRVRQAWKQHTLVVDPQDAARRIAEGRAVVFVDVREPEEFAEFHIPGAILAPLRDLESMDLSALEGAELVIPYCLKDFRGFEGAKTLRRRGIVNVALLAGFGIKSWKKAGLPVAGSMNGLSDQAARERLIARAGL